MTGDQEGSRLTEIAEDWFLMEVVTQPVSENNTLDLVLLTDLHLISDCEEREKLNACGHH